MGTSIRVVISTVVAAMSAAACIVGDSDGRAAERRADRDRAPKVLTIAVQGEPVGFVDLGGTRAGAQTGTRYAMMLAHDTLTGLDEQSARVPRLAAEVISVDKGTWRLNPDGTMDTVWTIRSANKEAGG